MAAKKTVRRGPVQRPEVNLGVDDDELEEEELETGTDDDTDNPDDDNPADESAEAEAVLAEPLERMMGAPKDGPVFRAGEDIVFKGEKRGGVIISSQNVYRGVKAPGSSRFRFHLVVGKGGEVPAKRAKEITKGEYQATMHV